MENNVITTFRGWPLYETLPQGWVIDRSCGSPLHGYEFCTDGKSILNGGKRALVKVKKKTIDQPKPAIPALTVAPVEPLEPYTFPAKAVNTLARKKFQERLLQDIAADLMVCELEGWDKKEYIRELQTLINSLHVG